MYTWISTVQIVQGHISQMPKPDDLRTRPKSKEHNRYHDRWNARNARVVWCIIYKTVQIQRHPRTKDVTSCYYTFDVGIFVGSVPRQAVT
jgi:hypothetical protein